MLRGGPCFFVGGGGGVVGGGGGAFFFWEGFHTLTLWSLVLRPHGGGGAGGATRTDLLE